MSNTALFRLMIFLLPSSMKTNLHTFFLQAFEVIIHCITELLTILNHTITIVPFYYRFITL
jgi:hypothetical protein